VREEGHVSTRSANRDRAYELWAEAKGKRLLKDIAQELGVTPRTISKWKKQDAWMLGRSPTALKKKGGAPKGNRNAVGKKGGGAPKGSKFALRTGEYESILINTLTDEERSLIPQIQLDKVLVLHEELMLLTIRERTRA